MRVTIPPRDDIRFTGEIAKSAVGKPVVGLDGSTKVGEIMGAYVSEDGYLTLDLTTDVECLGLALDRDMQVSLAKTWRYPWRVEL